MFANGARQTKIVSKVENSFESETCTVRKSIEEMVLRICQPLRGLFYFSLSSTFIPNK